jgi:hypothetical protein
MLNRAHWLHRQAEKAARKGRVEEAVAFHKEAADVLNQLLQTILDEKVAESVRLQAQLHEKERVILRHQRKKAEKVYRDLESLRKMAGRGAPKSAGDGDSLQLSIYRKFEETENLLDQLRIQDDTDSSFAGTSVERSFSAIPPPDNYVGKASEIDCKATSNVQRDIVVGVASKKPKDEKVIIEELQVANSHLRKMVDSLFFELSACQRDNLELKARVNQLECLHGQQQQVHLSQHHHPVQVSQSAQQSPQHGFCTFKPDNSTPVRIPEQRAGQHHPQPPRVPIRDDTTSLQSSLTIAEECDLPPLPPLEMPTFDFDKRPEV